MNSYRDTRGTEPDFRVSYGFLSEAEGGRRTLPFQHIRSDFLYEGDDPQADGIWCIWPEFVSANGAVLSENQPVPAEGLADWGPWGKATAFIYPPSGVDSLMVRADMGSASPDRHTLQAAD